MATVNGIVASGDGVAYEILPVLLVQRCYVSNSKQGSYVLCPCGNGYNIDISYLDSVQLRAATARHTRRARGWGLRFLARRLRGVEPLKSRSTAMYVSSI